MDKYIKSLQGKVVASGDGFYIDGDDWDNLISKLRAADELLSEGLSIIQDHSPGYTVFISEALQYLGLEG
jgi:hypothetical protein